MKSLTTLEQWCDRLYEIDAISVRRNKKHAQAAFSRAFYKSPIRGVAQLKLLLTELEGVESKWRLDFAQTAPSKQFFDLDKTLQCEVLIAASAAALNHASFLSRGVNSSSLRASKELKDLRFFANGGMTVAQDWSETLLIQLLRAMRGPSVFNLEATTRVLEHYREGHDWSAALDVCLSDVLSESFGEGNWDHINEESISLKEKLEKFISK